MTELLIRLFVRDYKDTTSPRGRERYGKFSSLVGIATNLLLCLLKGAAAAFPKRPPAHPPQCGC